MGKYKVQVDPPDYLIGYGPEFEFVVIAKTYSKVRAEQITRLLNKDEVVCEQVKKESEQ